MSAMPPTRRTSASWASPVLRAGCLTLAFASAVGLFLTAPAAPSASADTSSLITVKWNGDPTAAGPYQPVRSDSSPQFKEFENLAVKVSQTRNLGDQAIRVDVSGFAGTRGATDSGGQQWTAAMNFMQAMQCWGPDPLAADFVQTCQWGGRYVANNGVEGTVYADNVPRVSIPEVAPSTSSKVDNPFRTVQGRTITARQVNITTPDPKDPTKSHTVASYPLLDFFNPATTNEVQSARINGDGTGYFLFETQSSDQAPQLGCGSEGHQRCWLVLVPRGTVYSGNGEKCSSVLDGDYNPYANGRPNSIQGGSPVNPECGYWQNRINVPLDFDPTGSSCAAGASERRVIGSQLMVGAMSSWQSALCIEQKAAFNFSTNPDRIGRLQLLDGKAGAAFTSWPLSVGELEFDNEREAFATTALSYAPVAVTAPVVAFFAESSSGRQEELNVSPRLIAKLLTQSYVFTVPNNSSDPEKNFAHLAAVNRSYKYLKDDPEFKTLNPNLAQFDTNPAIVLPGPAGADALRQLWRWILADSDSRAWLDGAKDPWGMTVNPYYLPKGHPDAQVPTFELDGPNEGKYKLDAQGNIVMRQVGLIKLTGEPLKLSETATDSLMKADESQVPIKRQTEKYRFDSLQFAPYSESLLAAARDTFRADPHSKTIWDPQRMNAAGEIGDWVSSGAQIPGKRFMIALTDAASAERYGLNAAALQRANSTELVKPTPEAMGKALASLKPTDSQSVFQVDPAVVPSGGYPLTTVVYQAVNLTVSDAKARAEYAGMISQVTTRGQIPGTARGELPRGYVPLSAELAAKAAAAAAAISVYTEPVPAAEGSSGPAQDDYAGLAALAQDAPALAVGTAPGTATLSETPIAVSEVGRTPGLTASDVGRSGLALSLGLGLSGALFAPRLLRGRRLLL